MKKTVVAVALPPATRALVMLAAVALSGCAGVAGGFRDRQLNATEKMMWSTYPLATRKGMGTGFVIARSHSRLPVLITSSHVLETVGRGPFVIGARVPEASGEVRAIALIQFQPPRGKERFYVRHPRLDLAAFALDLPAELAASTELPTFLDERSLATRAGALRTGAEVSFLGFPEVLPGTAGAFPVLRTGRVASYPVGTAGSQGLFLVDADVYAGDSGAPVFVAGRPGPPELVGMIIRRVGLDRRAFSHLAIAVEASAIGEILQLLAAREGGAAPARRADGQDRTQLGQALRSGGARSR